MIVSEVGKAYRRECVLLVAVMEPDMALGETVDAGHLPAVFQMDTGGKGRVRSISLRIHVE